MPAPPRPNPVRAGSTRVLSNTAQSPGLKRTVSIATGLESRPATARYAA